MNVEGVKTIVKGTVSFDLVVTYGIGIVPNADGPPCRHASGYEDYEAERSTPPDWKIWPVLPPYDNFVDYVKFHMGRMIVEGAEKLEKDAAIRQIEPSILQQARVWFSPEKRPAFTNIRYWHNPS